MISFPIRLRTVWFSGCFCARGKFENAIGDASYAERMDPSSTGSCRSQLGNTVTILRMMLKRNQRL